MYQVVSYLKNGSEIVSKPMTYEAAYGLSLAAERLRRKRSEKGLA